MPEIKAIKKLQEYLENPQNITKPGLKGISDSINKELRFLPIQEQERLKELYKDELSFLNAILRAPTPSEYIAQNPDAISRILNKNVKIDKQEESSSYVQPEVVENSQETISIYKQAEVINSNLEQLQECMGNYIEVLSEIKFDENEENIENIITRLKEIEDKVKPISDYFHNGSAKFQKNSLNKDQTKEIYTFFTDMTYESLDLLNSIKYHVVVCEEEQISSCKETLDDKKVEEKINDAKQRISDCSSYFKKRHAYYSKLYEQTKDKKIVKKIDELEKIMHNCDFLYGELEKNGIEEVESHTSPIEEKIEDHIDAEEYYSQEQGIKQEEQDVIDPNATLTNDEYFESLLGLYGGKEEEQLIEESYMEVELEDEEKIVSDELNKKEQKEESEAVVEEEILEANEKESKEKNNPVFQRINDMLNVEDINSKKDIQKELDNIYNEMLAPKKKKSFFKKEKRKPYGDINEDLFMDIRRVFTKISIETEIIEADSIDKFAKELFEDGNPKYLLGEMDQKTQEIFSEGISKYIEMSENKIFTQREKENFEKFVIRPYMLRNIQGKEKDFFDKLQEETFSQEDIVQNLGLSDDDFNIRKTRTRNENKVK